MHFRQWKRREFITLFGGAAAWPITARAQQGERMRRIGVLFGAGVDDGDLQARHAAFLQALQQLGWTDSGNVRIDTRFGAGNADNIRRYAAELATLAPDVILARLATSWSSYFRRLAPCRSCSWLSPIRSAQAMSIVCRGRAATSPALCSSNTI